MKSYLLSVWNVIDPIYFNCTRLRYVQDHERGNTIFRVRLTRYKGRSIRLMDGTIIQKYDLLVKIHLHNVRMLSELKSIKSEMKKAVYVYHLVKRALPSLAQYIENHYKNVDIKGIVGITTLYRGAERLGFELAQIQNMYYRLYKKGTFLPINLLANTSGSMNPVYLFMSINQLKTKYRL